MKTILMMLSALLLLSACEGRNGAAPKIAAPQRADLDKAKAVDQTVQQADQAQKKQMDDATQ